MAGEIQLQHHTTAKTVYVQIRDATGQVWDVGGAAFGAYATGNRDNYDLVLTEEGTASRYYVATMPAAIPAGVYLITAYEQAGGSPAEVDDDAGFGEFHWDGTVLVPLSSLATPAQVKTQADQSLIDIGLDHMVNIAVVGADVTDNSIMARLVSKAGIADWDSFDNTTDSQEALADSVASLPTPSGIADQVWDEDRSGHAVVGSFGEGVNVESLNATARTHVKSEAAQTLVDIGLDHLLSASVAGGDVADNSVFARMVSKSATADWDTFDQTTDSLEAIRDNLGGSAPTAAAIADAVWDEARSGHVGVGSFGEGVLVESLNTQANADVNAQADLALVDIGATLVRMGYLDNLNIGENVAGSSEVTSIQNNTKAVRVVPPVMERPDSGTTVFRIELFLYDSEGNMEAPDSSPTIDAVNNDGSDRTANLDATTMSLISTGRYRSTYTVGTAHLLEPLHFTFTVLEGGNTRLYGNATVVLDDTVIGFTSSDRTDLQDILTDTANMQPKLGTPVADISTDIAAIKAVADAILVDTGTSGVIVATNNDKTGYSISGTITTLDGLNNLSTANIDARLAAIGLDHLVAVAVLGSDVADNSIMAKLVSKSAIADWDTFQNIDDSLEANRDRGDSAWKTATSVNLNADQTHVTIGLIQNLAAPAKSSVRTEVDNALIALRLDHLMSTSAVDGDVANDSIIAQMTAKGGTANFATFNNVTDSLEALADNTGLGLTAATIADAVWDEARAAHVIGGTFGEGVGVEFFTTTAKTELEAEANDALVGQNLDHLVKSGVSVDFATTVHLDSVIGQMVDVGTAATFTRTTDSLEAIRNNQAATAPSPASIADAVWDEIQADHVAVGSFGAIASEIADILLDTDELQSDWENNGRLDLILDSRSSHTAADVWTVTTRTLTAFAFNVTVGTNLDKTGYFISGTKNTLDTLNDISTTQVGTEVATALTDIHLDHFFATAIGSTMVGVAGSLIYDSFEYDGPDSMWKYTVNVLENAPGGTLAGSDVEKIDEIHKIVQAQAGRRR